MRRKIGIALAITLVAVLWVGAVGFAQTGGDWDLRWHVMGGAGSAMQGGGFAMTSTLGQVIVASSAGGTDRINHGFWYGVPPEYHNYLPLILRSGS